jgi:hypothetical protein
MPAFVNIFDEA